MKDELTDPLDGARRNTRWFHRHFVLPPTTPSSSSTVGKNPFTVTTSCATTATVTMINTRKISPTATVAAVTTTAASASPSMTTPSCRLHGNGPEGRVGYHVAPYSQHWVPPTGREGRIHFKSPQPSRPPLPPAAPLPLQNQFSSAPWLPQDQLSSFVSTRHPGDNFSSFFTPQPPQVKFLPSANLLPQMPVPSTPVPLPPGDHEPQSLGVDLSQLVREVQGKLCTILDPQVPQPSQ